jgi:hypothetical protein
MEEVNYFYKTVGVSQKKAMCAKIQEMRAGSLPKLKLVTEISYFYF